MAVIVEALARRFSCYLTSIHAEAEDDREVIEYGLFNIFSGILQILFLALSAFVFGLVPEVLVYTVFFGTLKRYAGGAHANRHWVCLWGFTALAIGSSVICSIVSTYVMPHAAIIAAFATLLIVLVKAPVMHPNNPKSPKRLRKFRGIAVAIAVTQFTVLLGLSLFAPEQIHVITFCASTGGLTAAVTLLLPMPSKIGEEVD